MIWTVTYCLSGFVVGGGIGFACGWLLGITHPGIRYEERD